MPDEALDSLGREKRLDEAVIAFLEAQESGQQPCREDWLTRYPDVAAELERFFADQDEVDRLTGPVRAALRGTPPPGDTPQPGQQADGSNPISPSASTTPPEGYELLQVLGQGGMGIVYKARQKNAGRVVALKLIRADRLSSEADMQRFRNEAEAAAQLDHPNIVPVYEVGARQGHLFFSMKLIEGGGLDERLNRFRDDPHSAARLLAQVARAVHHAHQRGILHRDLKPSNILLDREGQPHVSDFGLSKRIEFDGSLTQTGAIVGTPQYMAPEQATGRKGEVTTATDVYGLGSVLYALLTGRPPFQGETVLETLEQVREREPESPRRIDSGVDCDLDTICLKCLQKESQRRYESAQALAEDLERWLRGEPIQARRIGWGTRTWRWCWRNPFLAALTGLSAGLALALLVGLGVSTWLISGQRDEIRIQHELTLERDRVLRLHLYTSDIRLAWQALRESELERMRGLLDRHIPEIGEEELRGFEWDYLQRRSQGVLHEVAQVAAHEGDAYCVKYSPDGRTLASSGKDSVIRLWDSYTLDRQGELRGDQGEINEVVFAPDGRTLASAGDDRTVWLWDLASGRRRDILRPEGCRDELSTLAISPDGKVLAAGGKDGQLWSWDFASGKLNAKCDPGNASIHYLSFAPGGQFLAAASHGGRVLLLDPVTLRERGGFQHPYGIVECVTFSHDGKTLAAGSNWRGRILLWDLTTQTQRIDLLGHRGSVRSLSFSSDDTLLVSCGDDGSVKLWDVHSGSLRASMQGHTGRAWCTALASDGTWLATAGQDGNVKLWRVLGVDHRRIIRVLSKVKDWIAVDWVAFSPDGQTLFTRTETEELARWNTFSGRRTEPVREPAGSISLAALAPASRLATVAGDKQNLRVRDLAGAAVQVYRHTQPISAVAMSRYGQRIAFADTSPAVWMWDVDSSQPRKLAQLSGFCRCLALAPDGRTIMAGADTHVFLLDASGGQPLAVLSGHENEILTLDVCSDGKLLATTAREDNTIRIWEVSSGRERYCLWTHRRSVNTVAFSPDGKTLASGDGTGEVILWNVAGGQELMRLDDYRGQIRALAFSPDGKILAAGGHGPDTKSAEATFWYSDGARPTPSLEPSAACASPSRVLTGALKTRLSVHSDWKQRKGGR